ncbi:MAG: TIGR03663 family protein [Anaerolineae bacterium]|nr:TIGR03663 family protein [Anaerolineae bacterium]
MQWQKLSRWERVVFVVILVLALLSRFYILGERVTSHDESLHTKFSFYLYAGQGYTHNPMMHGPLLFHLTALSYFLFGVSDFTARIVPALFGVALALSPFLFRRQLGRFGTVAASIMLLVSPTISYYSRYIRHDILNMLAAVVLIWAILQYLAEGKARWLYVLTAAFAFMFTTKETAYIYTAIFFILLTTPLAWQVLSGQWVRPRLFTFFLIAVAVILISVGIFALALTRGEVVEEPLQGAASTAETIVPLWGKLALGVAGVAMVSVVGLAFLGYGEGTLRRTRWFDLLMLMGTLTLPLGAAVVIRLAGVNMLDLYNALIGGHLSNLIGMDLYVTLGITLAMLIGSVLLGLWWHPRRWPAFAAIHYSILAVFYTTVFTNPLGFLSGLLGALAYWLAQQGVERGGQPEYYYALLMPLYEYLPLLLSLTGVGGALATLLQRPSSPMPPVTDEALQEGDATLPIVEEMPQDVTMSVERFFPVFLLGWTALSWLAYTAAGEKMPWLTVHIALPTIFLAAWGVDWVLKDLDLRLLVRRWGWLVAVALGFTAAGTVVFVSSVRDSLALLSAGVSPAGFSLAQLQEFGRAIGGLLGAVVSLLVLIWATRRAGTGHAMRAAFLAVAAFLTILSLRTMTAANFVNHDLAKEFMVYAHAAPDVKVALEQIQDISWRTTGSPYDVKIAYGQQEYTVFSWYMVKYPNAVYYGDTPDPNTLKDFPVIIAGSDHWSAVDAIVGYDYDHFDYKFLWWPIEDYKGLTWERIRESFTNTELRAALWDIIWNRDYDRYAQVKGRTITLQQWPYRNEFRLYVKKDLANEVWGYRYGSSGYQVVGPEPTPLVDPYSNQPLDVALLSTAILPGAAPRGLAVAADGSLYVADTTQQRLWHVNAQGAILNAWGEPGTGPGQFQEPWGVAVDAEGNVYVADTWNHRIQKFNAQGDFLLSWGTFGQFMLGDLNGRGAFYGPRGVAVGRDGRVYVTDTGNKRVQVFDAQGQYLSEFGGGGRNPGQLNEPVGIAISANGEVFVADSWNQRIQVFNDQGVFLRQWSVPTWSVQNPEDKPYIAVDSSGSTYIGDAERGRVLVFDGGGGFLGTLGAFQGLDFPVGVAVSAGGQLYVADAHAAQVLGFSLP